ncbi:hypothetical protein, partial [Frankia casuarinae]
QVVGVARNADAEDTDARIDAGPQES